MRALSSSTSEIFCLKIKSYANVFLTLPESFFQPVDIFFHKQDGSSVIHGFDGLSDLWEGRFHGLVEGESLGLVFLRGRLIEGWISGKRYMWKCFTRVCGLFPF